MSRQISASGSSHLWHFRFNSGWQKKRLGINHPFQIFTRCSSLSGLSVMDDRYEKDSFSKLPSSHPYNEEKNDQRGRFIRSLERGQEKEILLVLLSNDYKAFIIDDSKQKPFKLALTAHKKWNKMTLEEKISFNIFKENIWKPQFRIHILEQMKKYGDILRPILAKTSLEIVHHSSVIERLHFEIVNLDLYFAIINSVLQHFLVKWTDEKSFQNKFGKDIKFQFVSVKKQLHFSDKFEEKVKIFKDNEIAKKKELVHRTPESNIKLAKLWVEALQ